MEAEQINAAATASITVTTQLRRKGRRKKRTNDEKRGQGSIKQNFKKTAELE
jgi:hypothetical protein